MAETANVDVLISAFTDQAEESIEGVGDELLGLAADGEISQSVLDEVADEMDDAALSAILAGEMFDDLSGDAAQLAVMMTLLDNRANSAGNQLTQAGGQAATASPMFSGLSVGVGALNFSFMGLSATIWAVLLPALAALLTTLAPLVALLGGAVTAAVAFGGAMAGLGIAGVVTETEMLKNALADARDEILEIIEPLGELGASVLLTLINELPDMVQGMVDAAGGAEQLAWWMEELGLTVMELVPGMVGFAVALAEDVAPAIAGMIAFLEGNGPGLVESFFSTFEELEPELAAFGAAMMDFLPVLLDFGTEVLALLLPALAGFALAMANLMRSTDFEQIRSGLSQVGDAMDTVGPKFDLFIGRVMELMPALLTIASEGLPFLARATAQFFDVLAALIDPLTMLVDLMGADGLRVVVIALAGALAVLGGPISAIAGAAVIAATAVPMMTDAFNALKEVAANVADDLSTFFTRDLPQMLVFGTALITGLLTTFGNQVYNLLVRGFRAAAETITEILNGVGQRVNTMLNAMLEQINEAIEAANARVPGMDMDTFEEVERMDIETGEMPEERETRSPDRRAADQARRMAATLNLDVDGEGPLADWLQDMATVEEDDRRAQQDRYQKRNNIGTSN